MKRTITMLAVLGGTLGLSACVGDTDSATHIRATQAQLNAHGRTDHGPAQWWWEYGTSQSAVQDGNGTKVCGNPPEPDGKCGPAESAQEVKLSVTVKNLSPSTTYWFRACGQDAGASPACGSVKSFKTTSGDSVVSIENGLNGLRYVLLQAAAGTQNIIIGRDAEVNGVLHYTFYEAQPGTEGTSLIPGAGCEQHPVGGSGYDSAVRCPAAGIDALKANLGDRSDYVEMLHNTAVPAWLDGGSGHDDLYGSRNGDRMTGGSGADFFSGRGGSDTINARASDVDEKFYCGETGEDEDTVTADTADPVTASASDCETVNKQ